jgi:hypothetical protein
MSIDQCKSDGRTGLIWVRLGLWKLRGERRNAEKGRCPLCNEDENVVNILLKRNETQRWRGQFLDNKPLNTNEEIA